MNNPQGLGGGRYYPVNQEGFASPEYGRGAPILKKKYFLLTNARDLEKIEIAGSTLWALNASSFTATINIRINTQQDDPFEFSLGMFIRGTPFSRVYVSNDAQAGEWIEIAYMAEDPRFIGKMEIANPASQFNEVDLVKPASFVTVADVNVNGATGLVLAALATRRVAIISNLAVNPNPVRVGDVNTGAARGAEIPIGGSASIYSTDDIYVYSAGNSNIGVSYTGD